MQLTQSGTYTDTLQGSNGCDSIITLNLTVSNVLAGSFSWALCSGTSYNFNGDELTQAGSYTDTLQTVGGCDSIITLTLTLNNSSKKDLSDTICAGDIYLFGNNSITIAGTYTDTLQTIYGCDSLVTLTLVVNALPQPTIAKNADTLTTQAFATTQWLENDSAISGATTQSLIFTHAGNYSVLVTDENGCSDTSAIMNVNNLDVKNMVSDLAVNLYPNPNTGTFTVQFSNTAIREIEIADAVGRTVFSSLFTEKANQIKLEETSGGIYLLRVKQNMLTQIIRFSLIK
jgi:hypothetical protein